jgi:hypothetical protein
MAMSMKFVNARHLAALFLAFFCFSAWALPPYRLGNALPQATLEEQLARVQNQLQTAGFTVVGRHIPAGIPDHGVVVFTDKAWLAGIGHAGGLAILAAPLRVGVTSQGDVSYTTPEYWARAYLQDKYPAAEATVKALQSRLTKAVGDAGPMGGDIAANALADYHYMAGMEKLDSFRSELQTFPSFEEALKTVRANLAKGVEGSAKVYEIVSPEQKLAVIGVAMSGTNKGEAWWVNKLGPVGPQHIAALPYEIAVVNNKVYSPFGRYRIALAWPELDLGQFMTIRYAPDVIAKTMQSLAGGGN